MMTIVLFLVGLALLIAGAQALVRGAVGLAALMGVPPLLIGLTVVAFGVSSAELAVSMFAAYTGQADISIGNIVGSNIFNVLLVLGVAALITPLIVAQQLVRLDVPIMIGASFLMLLLGADGKIGRGDGMLLFALLIAYTIFVIRQSGKEGPRVREEYAQAYPVETGIKARQLKRNVGLVVIGLMCLLLGSRWSVNAAVAIAQYFGVGQLVIGLTIVAAGTSLPELATALVAGLRGERDIVVGSVIGGNIFHILAVLGLSGLVAPGGVMVSSDLLRFDMPVMILVALTCVPIFSTGLLIARWEGFLFLTYYLAYLGYLILAAMQHEFLPIYGGIVVSFMLPVTWLAWLILHDAYRQTGVTASPVEPAPLMDLAGPPSAKEG
jgi:cation:H+ antiporter